MRNTAKTLHPAYRGGYKPILALCIFLLLISCLFLFSNLAIAATYYLDAVRGNDSNPGTSAKPWKTINKAKSTIMEGDYVIVRNGSYGSYNEADVNRTDWVTYQAATGHTPILSGISIDNYPVACNSYLKEMHDTFNLKIWICQVQWTRCLMCPQITSTQALN